MLNELVGHHLADVLGEEPLVLQPHVSPVLDRRDDRCVRGGTADPELLERLHERCLREPRRRLREVLLGQDLEHPQNLLGRQIGQTVLRILVGPVVAPLGVDADEPVEHHRLPRGS